jgi:pimeloyl-ACP methyl ester carboxylesterase
MFLVSLPYYAGEQPRTVASSDSVEIAYTVRGEGKPALVFVHGWCCDRTYWRSQVSHFSKTHQVVTIDLAGHGESGTNRESWTIEAFGEDVVAVVEKLGLDDAVLVGHSMGGLVNAEAAQRMPGRVVGLVGVDTYQNLEHQFSDEQKAGFIAAFKADFTATTQMFVRSMFQPDADSILVAEVVDDMASAPPEVGVGAMESTLNYKSAEAFEGLEIPVYCINSDKWPTDVDAGRRHTHSFEVKLMPGLGHFLMMEDPEAFDTMLTEVIAELWGE